jgi:hypothetical protein
MQINNLLENPDNKEEDIKGHARWNTFRSRTTLFVVGAFLIGMGSGYLIRGRSQQPEVVTQTALGAQGSSATDMAAFVEQVNPADGYNLSVSYGDLGPQVLSAGGIDYSAFVSLYESSSRPLSSEQIEILTKGTDKPIVVNAENAHFLLNFFWAVGLVNANPILTDGPITQNSEGQVGRFASTGGWTLGAKPVTELFASQTLITLTPQQQARVEEAAALIYRPCCNNPTLFPDCNHGMAMLGLLELMASQNASLEEMLQAAKYVNAFWFPQQALETAIFLEATQSTSFRDADPALVVGKEMHSSSGFAAVHQYLQSNGLLAQTPGSGSSCAN